MNRTLAFFAAVSLFAAGCSATTVNVGSLVLPTSNRTIDVVQHRSDSKGCAELVVIQTYSDVGSIIDSKEGRGQSLPCLLTGATIEAGSRLGSAAIVARGLVNAAKSSAPDNINVGQVQVQGQQQQIVGGGEGNGGGGTGNGGAGGDVDQPVCVTGCTGTGGAGGAGGAGSIGD